MRAGGIIKTLLQGNILLMVGVIFEIGLIMLSTIIFAKADSINPGVYSPDSKPFGLTYAEWSGKWWQWWLSHTQADDPASDSTGKNCAQKQSGPVWFLAGTVGGSAERTCTIPSGKAIMFPIIGSECSYTEYPNVKSESGLNICAQADNNAVTDLETTIDGVKLQDLKKYRVSSPIFNILFQEDNPLGAPAGPTQMVSDGFYVFLEPLSIGKHELHFSGTTIDNPTTGTTRLAIEVTYHLTVVPS